MNTVSVFTKTTRDPRWFEEVTKLTANWDPPEYANAYDMEMWILFAGDGEDEWARWQVTPATKGVMWIEDNLPNYSDMTFYLRSLETNIIEEWPLDGGGYMKPTFSPPANNSVWMWDGVKNRFMLRSPWWLGGWRKNRRQTTAAWREDDTQRR